MNKNPFHNDENITMYKSHSIYDKQILVAHKD
jgi:hypothetical protein